MSYETPDFAALPTVAGILDRVYAITGRVADGAGSSSEDLDSFGADLAADKADEEALLVPFLRDGARDLARRTSQLTGTVAIDLPSSGRVTLPAWIGALRSVVLQSRGIYAGSALAEPIQPRDLRHVAHSHAVKHDHLSTEAGTPFEFYTEGDELVVYPRPASTLGDLELRLHAQTRDGFAYDASGNQTAQLIDLMPTEYHRALLDYVLAEWYALYPTNQTARQLGANHRQGYEAAVERFRHDPRRARHAQATYRPI